MARYEDLSVSVLQLVPFTKATLPSAADYEGSLVYVSDGIVGPPAAAVVAFSDGTNWLRVDTLAIVV